MAIEFLRAFGHPADVAARYRPALTIIEPSDGSTSHAAPAAYQAQVRA